MTIVAVVKSIDWYRHVEFSEKTDPRPVSISLYSGIDCSILLHSEVES